MCDIINQITIMRGEKNEKRTVPNHHAVSVTHLFHLSRNDERFFCVLYNHSHPNLSFCDYIPHHKFIKNTKKQRTSIRDMYIKKPSLISQEWFFVWSIAGSNR